ncbi:MAG: HTH-type transcriptional regulator IscR [Myxococcota bacterium]|nr:HTH-type transcriptional regulator IscR [Myxococcota bacterium]
MQEYSCPSGRTFVRLSNKSRYALRAMFDLAYFCSGGPATVAGISQRQGIPARFLEQIFQDLKRAGIIRSKRGPQGGYTISRPVEKILLGDIIRAIEGPIDFVRQDNGEAPVDENNDSVRVVIVLLKRVAARMNGLLDEFSLADLCAIGDDLGLRDRSAKELMYFI